MTATAYNEDDADRGPGVGKVEFNTIIEIDNVTVPTFMAHQIIRRCRDEGIVAQPTTLTICARPGGALYIEIHHADHEECSDIDLNPEDARKLYEWLTQRESFMAPSKSPNGPADH
jgi:hypothetical protein